MQWTAPDGLAVVAVLDAATDALEAVASLQPAAIDAIAQELHAVADLGTDSRDTA